VESNKPTRTFVVIGAGGSIGSSVSKTLHDQGAQLALLGRNSDSITEPADHKNVIKHPVDATNFEDVEKKISIATDHFGHIDGVVNCVGSLLLKPAHSTTEEDLKNTIDTNLGSAFATVRAVAKVIKKDASVILLSSSAAEVGIVNHEAIAAAKAAIIGLARSAAATYASRNLRFNCIAPGMVRTKLTAPITQNEVALKGSVAMHALGRIGEPDEIGRTIAFFLSPEQSWITGQVLSVDGGLSRVRTRAKI
jgi:3-oxoacyl-[acyl-carrier protein] reductase